MPENLYELNIFIQHAVWDSMSSEFFEKSLKNIINDLKDGKKISYSRNVFSKYIKLLRENMNYAEIQNHENDELISGLKEFAKTYDSNNKIQYVYARLNLPKNKNDTINDKAITFSAKLFDKNLILNNKNIKGNLPISILYHGRDSDEECLGLYLVLIPLLRRSGEDNLEMQFNNLRNNFDRYKANLISEILFEYLPEGVEIPMYINFKNIFTLTNENTKLLNINKVDIHSIIEMNDTLGIELMILDNVVHVLFPAYTKDKNVLKKIIEELLKEI